MELQVNPSRASIFLGFVAVYILVFLPVVVGEFGHSDDFSMLVNYQSGREAAFWVNTHFAWGRPLLGFYDGIFFQMASSVADFGWIRLLGIIGAGLFAGLLFRLYSRHEDSLVSLVYAVGISTTPAFGVFMGWATCSAHAYASLLALAAGMLVVPTGTDAATFPKRAVWAGVGLFAAECIYQPAASFFLLPLIVGLTFYSGTRLDIRKWSLPVAVFIATVGLYFLFTKAVTKFFFEGTWLAERMRTDFDPFEKLSFLLRDTLPTALGGWGAVFGPPWATLAIVVTVLLSVAALSFLCRLSDPLRRIGLIVIACGLGVAPLVAAGENYTPPRTLPFVYGILLHFAAFGLIRLLRCAGEGVCRLTLPVAPFGLLGLASLGVFMGFVQPGMHEIAAIRDQLRRTTIENSSMPIVVMIPKWPQPPGTRIRPFHEYGSASSWTEWGVEAKMTMVLREHGRIGRDAVADVIVIGVHHEWDHSVLPNVDLYAAFGVSAPQPSAGLGSFASEWGALGQVVRHAHGWMYSPWLGFFQSWSPVDLRHPHLGTVRVEAEEKGVTLHTERRGVLRVPALEGPVVFITEAGESVHLEFRADGSVVQLTAQETGPF